jgi:ribonuclease D
MILMSDERYIDTEAQVTSLLLALEPEPVLAMDTEFVRESTYYPQLCLTQIAGAGIVACIDCVAGIRLPELFGRLAETRWTWLVHSARQDLEAIWVHSGKKPSRIIDTQLAAALLGYPPQISLQGLLDDILGVQLDKLHARTDWSRRPLTDAEIRYALDDVRHLAPLWQALEERLRAAGRMEWLDQDCQALLSEPHSTEVLQLWGRLPGVATLTREQQAAALALIEWREGQARQLDRPRRWILGDEPLMSLAKELPSSGAELGRIPALPRKLQTAGAESLLAAIQGRHDEAMAARIAAYSTEVPDRARVKALQKELKRQAAELGIVPEVLASRREIENIVLGRGQARTPWRMQILQQLLGTSSA